MKKYDKKFTFDNQLRPRSISKLFPFKSPDKTKQKRISIISDNNNSITSDPSPKKGSKSRSPSKMSPMKIRLHRTPTKLNELSITEMYKRQKSQEKHKKIKQIINKR